MGQKTNPIGMRLGIIATWDSRWFARKDYAKLLEEDIFIRKYLKKRLSQAGVSRIVIQRAPSKVTVNISDESTARKVMRLVEGLEEADDVQDVYANFDIPETVLDVVAS